jgi:hypothetical protein
METLNKTKKELKHLILQANNAEEEIESSKLELSNHYYKLYLKLCKHIGVEVEKIDRYYRNAHPLVQQSERIKLFMRQKLDFEAYEKLDKKEREFLYDIATHRSDR